MGAEHALPALAAVHRELATRPGAWISLAATDVLHVLCAWLNTGFRPDPHQLQQARRVCVVHMFIADLTCRVGAWQVACSSCLGRLRALLAWGRVWTLHQLLPCQVLGAWLLQGGSVPMRYTFLSSHFAHIGCYACYCRCCTPQCCSSNVPPGLPAALTE